MREIRHIAGDVEGHIPALRRYARGLIGSDGPDPVACADQMVREVVEQALQNGQLSAFKSPQLWLYATLTTRNRARRVRADGLAQRPRALGADPLAKLPLEEREALLLVVVEGFGYGQAASILGLSKPGVANRIARARQHLAESQTATSGPTPSKPRHPTYLRVVK